KAQSKKAFKPKLTSEERVKKDWLVMIIVFTILIVTVVGFDTYLFMRINAGDFFAPVGEVEDNETVVTKKIILDAENYFSTRQKEYEAFRNSPPNEIDPSI
ncbi:MAG TPA: hypothetical protein VK145_00395, partial [Candidatus Nanoarchaeia archaeon]|nr:hypothetical protein [Candidatus Nanoarchaeia archaeon]